jgi:hypothetical protein
MSCAWLKVGWKAIKLPLCPTSRSIPIWVYEMSISFYRLKSLEIKYNIAILSAMEME